MSGYDAHALPSLYWRDWMRAAQRKWSGPEGQALRALQARGFLAAVRPELVVAFIAPSSLANNTTDATTGLGLQVAFHEGGLYQIPMGPADRDPVTHRPRAPAPNPDRHAPNNTWGRLHDDTDVLAYLGHAASMAPDAWKTLPADQHAVGFAMLRDDYGATRAATDPTIRATDWGTAWGMATMFTGFSAGPGNAARLFDRFAKELAPVKEAQRFGALVNAACLALQAGWVPGGTADHHSNPTHRILRTWQKFAFAAALCPRVGTDPAVFDLGLGDQQATHEEMILRANYALPMQGRTVEAIIWDA